MATEKLAFGHHQLVVFDVEGVLLPKRRYQFFEATSKLSPLRVARVFLAGFLYEVGILPLESALREVYMCFKDLTIEDVFNLYRGIPLMPGAKEVFERLNSADYRTALISSGLPKPFVEDLASRLNADYADGLELETQCGHLTGKIGGDVIKPGGKAAVLRRIVEKEGGKPRDCFLVADDRNNLQMFSICATKIGYNPDFVISAKSNFVAKGDLTEILPYISKNFSKPLGSAVSRRDIFRETIHAGGFLIPLVCTFLLDRYVVSFLIFLVALLYIISEVARMKGTSIPILSTITWKAVTKPEFYEFATAPILFALGIAFSLVIFPSPVNYASIAILSLGDSSAAFFGKKVGKLPLPFNKGKSLEGLILGILMGFLGAQLFVNPINALVASIAGMVVETIPLPINDNVSVPLVSGLTLLVIP